MCMNMKFMTRMCLFGFCLALAQTPGYAVTVAGADASVQTRPAAEARFASPKAAVAGLVEAMRSNDTNRLHEILGQEADRFIQPADPALFNSARLRFLAAFDAKSHLENKGPHVAILHVGTQDWPFPFPMVRHAKSWHFDTMAGLQEWQDRRIGANELSTIQVLLAYVEAQRDFVHLKHERNDLLEYAQHIISTEGRHDGLYWPSAEGQPVSPLGQAFASASKAESVAHRLETHPYHGYFFHILTQQGPSAAGGALDYIVKGKMIGGFAMIAYPAGYGETGFKTFIVNHDGQVLSKDLGPQTATEAEAISSYDPDPSWSKEPR